MERLPFERPTIQKVNAGLPSKFGMANRVEPITHIEGIPVKELIEKYGSPLYTISEQTIRKPIRKPLGHFRHDTQRFSLPGATKPTILMQFVRFSTQKVPGQKLFRDLSMTRLLQMAFPVTK